MNVHVILGECVFTLLQLLSCQMVLLSKETLQEFLFDCKAKKKKRKILGMDGAHLC